MSTPDSDADKVRALLDHVDERVRGILALQGLLFAGLGFSWGKIFGLPLVFCVVGILGTIALIGETSRSEAVARLIINWWNERCGQYHGPPVLEERFALGDKPLGLSPLRLLHFALGVAWGAILILNIFEVFVS